MRIRLHLTRSVTRALARRDRPARSRWRGDVGNVMIMTLVLLVVGGMIVTGLLGYVGTVLRVRPPLEDRTMSAETARSAVRFALHQQRVNGPGDCFSLNTPVTYNEMTATVTCAIEDMDVDNPLMRGRFGIITTASTSTSGADPVAPLRWGSTDAMPDLRGDMFISGGEVASVGTVPTTGTAIAASYITPRAAWSKTPTPDVYAELGVPADCSTIEATALGDGVRCEDLIWTDRAGSSEDALTWSYPLLPPVPARNRDAAGVTMSTAAGSCTVHFPGRYVDPLDLNGGMHYFPSGVYYFEQPVTIRNGAVAVGGEGRTPGCVLDADAALDAAAPVAHMITGKGATFLLGGDAHLEVRRASLMMNRRLSTPTTRATEGVSVRTVTTSTIDTAELYVPADQVLPEEGLAPVPATTPNGAVTYTGSTLGLGDLAIDVDRGSGGPVGSATDPHRFEIDGQVFVPNAGIRLHDPGSHYSLKVTGGIVATGIDFDLAELPSTGVFDVGAGVSAVQTTFRMRSQVITSSGRETTSTALLQLHLDGSYAVNAWTVDVADGNVAPTVPTTVSPTSTTTTVPSGSTTTTSTTTTTTTTVPPGSCDAYENDGIWPWAKRIDVDETQHRELCRGSDLDWVKIQMQAGKQYTLTSTVSGSADTVFRLYGTNDAGTQVAYNDDYTGGSYASQIVYTPTATGMYYLRISQYASRNPGGEYTLTLTSSG
jgi:hypothetical protein